MTRTVSKDIRHSEAMSISGDIDGPPYKFSLAQQLQDTERHPVIVFGATAAGKSTMLMSLIDYLKQEGGNVGVGIELGEHIYPPAHPRRKTAHEAAINFYERHHENFRRDRQILRATVGDFPFYIPIDVTPTKRGSSAVKFAFLEGKGEWYERAPTKTGTRYQELKPEVYEVLENYALGLSVIFVAPYLVNNQDGSRLGDYGIGLLGMLQKYKHHRTAMQADSVKKDSLLFLLAKWDLYCDPLKNPQAFSQVRPDEVSQVLQGLYRESWNEFRALSQSRTGRRFFMQYVAGNIGNGIVQEPPDELRPTFERYPKVLLNWLYGNATRFAAAHRREVLFKDFVPKVEISRLERAMNFVFAR
jgi:hypothetical protein